MDLMIGLDLGTTTCKAIAMAANGQVLGKANRTYPLHSPYPGWAEQQTEEVWQAVLETLTALASQIEPTQVRGICLSGAMHSILPAASKGTPLAAAMTWADERAAPQAQALRTGKGDIHAIYQSTGCPVRSIYYPAKLRWWRAEAPEIFSQADYFVAIKDWIIYQLTGCWATDLGLASTTGLFNIHTLSWDPEALALGGIDEGHLPPLAAPADVVGELRGEVASKTGLPAHLPVFAGSNDGGLANLGSGAVKPGQSAITVGTSGAVRRILARPQLDPSERTWCYLFIKKHWFSGGAINNGGLALQWVRDHFYPDFTGEEGYRQLLLDARSVPAGAGGVRILPYFTGERSPYWDSGVRAMIFGLGLEHTRAHIARAVLEGVAFCLADVWEVLETHAPANQEVRMTGGITRSPLWIQIVADVLGVAILPTEAVDASVEGAALLGLHALGEITQLESLATRMQPAPVVEPDPNRHARYQELHHEFQALYRNLARYPNS